MSARAEEIIARIFDEALEVARRVECPICDYADALDSVAATITEEAANSRVEGKCAE